jgi:hypothetical protein
MRESYESLSRHPVLRAAGRARVAIVSVAATYAISVAIGMVMVHTGMRSALEHRDRLVDAAVRQDPAAQGAREGRPLRAAFWDFSGNLLLGAVPKTISGFGVVFPYPWIAYQGWVGGIVSVGSDGTSRLSDPRSAAYYFVTLVLQLVPYSLAIGAGVNGGLALFRPPRYYQGEKLLTIFPKEVLRDLGRVYLLVVPLFDCVAVGVPEPVEHLVPIQALNCDVTSCSCGVPPLPARPPTRSAR